MNSDEGLRLFAEHAEHDSLAFQRLQGGQEQILRELKDIHNQLSDLMAEMGGVPQRAYRADRPTIRERLHNLESSAEAVRITKDAVALMRQQHERSETRRWAVWQKWATLGGVMIAAVTSVARLFGIGP